MDWVPVLLSFVQNLLFNVLNLCFSWNFRIFIHFFSLLVSILPLKNIQVLIYLRNRSKIHGKNGNWRSFGFILGSITLMHYSTHFFCNRLDSKALSAFCFISQIQHCLVWNQPLTINKWRGYTCVPIQRVVGEEGGWVFLFVCCLFYKNR